MITIVFINVENLKYTIYKFCDFLVQNAQEQQFYFMFYAFLIFILGVKNGNIIPTKQTNLRYIIIKLYFNLITHKHILNELIHRR